MGKLIENKFLNKSKKLFKKLLWEHEGTTTLVFNMEMLNE
jgi:hypothetical protein